MTDLSKQLGEIKRRHERDVFRSPCPEKAHNDRAALLNIIEVQIPGMLRKEAVKIMSVARGLEDTKVDVAELVYAARVLNTQAALIESLTNESDRSRISDGAK